MGHICICISICISAFLAALPFVDCANVPMSVEIPKMYLKTNRPHSYTQVKILDPLSQVEKLLASQYTTVVV